ncbi:hypothetical protein HCN44_001913 [Aphidius gifuensis]|uniref:Amino acid transporter n=1 Tax=Aphidius gifuensis TaxID=684658 RepID=A0A834Y0D4_APHGI|nr:hypothetical protein HCN44_001913 [Aphidius gifuensis]
MSIRKIKMARPKKWKSCLGENGLTLFTVFGVIAGTVLGFSLKAVKTDWTPREIMYIEFPGDLFLRMLKALILPLIVSSIASAIGKLDLSLSSKIGMRSIYYYATTTICAVILGIILVSIIRPGVGAIIDTNDDDSLTPQAGNTVDTLLDLIRNIFPPNLLQACLQQYRTIITFKNETIRNATGDGLNLIKTVEHVGHEYRDGMNTLGLVIFSIILGITLSKMGEVGKPLLDFFTSLSEAMMIITNWIIWLSPIGVTFLVASKILDIPDIGAVAGALGWYFCTVLLGLFIHGFGTLSLIYYVCTREMPFKSIGKMSQVMVTAFGTASSSATLPITLQCLENMGVDTRISVTATAASIGAAGIPQAGLVTMVMVLDTLGLPAKDVTLIITVDWLLDRFRTTINVICDALAAIIIEKMSKDELQIMNQKQQQRSELEVELSQLNKDES